MPLADRLVHRIAIVAPTASGGTDDYNQPIAGEPSTTVLDGFLYPLSAREIAQANEAGAVIGDHDVIVPLREVPDAGFVRFDPDDGVRYRIRGHEPYRFGRDPLVVIHVTRITPDEQPAVGYS